MNKYNHLLLLVLSALSFLTACNPDDDHPVQPENQYTGPVHLLKAWIWPIANNSVRTYDFNQIQAAGRRTVEVRAWQQIGTLNWQSYQQYTFDFEATDKQVIMKSATGYTEIWDIIQVEDTRMLISYKGQEIYVYNCQEPGWPELVRQSMKSCR